MHENVYDAGIGHDHRPVGEHVRTDRRDTEGVHRRKDDGTAGGERIRGRAGGRGDDEAVGFIRRDEVIVDIRIQIDHAGEFGFGDDDIIESRVSTDSLPIAADFAIDHAAPSDAMFAAQCAVELGIKILHLNGSKEAQMAKIDGKKRNLAATYHARG